MLEPRSIDDENPVQFTLNSKGKLGITRLPIPLKSDIEMGTNKIFIKYHCNVQGSGEGTGIARWDFKENPDRRDGISQEQILNLTLVATGQITGEVLVSARIARPGLSGSIEAIRDLILGTQKNQRIHPISLEVPDKPASSILSRFFHE